MKVKIKRLLALAMVFALVLSLCGCSKKVNVSVSGTNTCGTFTVSGTLANSGTVTLSGTLIDKRGYSRTVKNQKYTYKRSGSSVTFTRKGGDWSAPKTVKGTYNSKTNTFVLNTSNYCELYS